ncbi:MAG: flagellar biosynthetic protein FliR, partial [Oscillospiraceae bacterium]
FLLAFARMIGFLFSNSIFGKKNVPSVIKVGLAGAFALSSTLSVKQPGTELNGNILTFGLTFSVEFFLGFAISFIIGMLLSAIIFGGELLDMQMGISMNKFYDATSGTDVPTIGLLLRVLFMLEFFLTNSHYNLVKIVNHFFSILPVGQSKININALFFVTNLMKEIFEIGLKLAMPMIAAILVVDIGIGILMRAIPQLNVFVLNIYVKFIIGFLLLLKISPDLVEFSQTLTEKMFFNIEKFLRIAVMKQ